MLNYRNQVNIKLDDITKDKLEYLMDLVGMSQSELIRQLIQKEYALYEKRNYVLDLISSLNDKQLQRILNNIRIELGN